LEESQEGFKLTAGKHKFMHEAGSYLRTVLDMGKERGLISRDTKIKLYYNKNLEGISGEVDLCFEICGKKRRPLYVVDISPSAIGDWGIIRHEAGHIVLGHPEKGPSTSKLEDWGDFLGFVRRDLKADFISRRATEGLPYLYEDIAFFVRKGIRDFGFEPSQSFELVKQTARGIHIPFQYIKQARKELVKEGYLE